MIVSRVTVLPNTVHIILLILWIRPKHNCSMKNEIDNVERNIKYAKYDKWHIINFRGNRQRFKKLGICSHRSKFRLIQRSDYSRSMWNCFDNFNITLTILKSILFSWWFRAELTVGYIDFSLNSHPIHHLFCNKNNNKLKYCTEYKKQRY